MKCGLDFIIDKYIFCLKIYYFIFQNSIYTLKDLMKDKFDNRYKL